MLAKSKGLQRERAREREGKGGDSLACYYKGTSSTSNKATLNVTSCPNKICNFNATTMEGRAKRREQGMKRGGWGVAKGTQLGLSLR